MQARQVIQKVKIQENDCISQNTEIKLWLVGSEQFFARASNDVRLQAVGDAVR
jgi:hypothetical protein